jgi:hypothetical protein
MHIITSKKDINQISSLCNRIYDAPMDMKSKSRTDDDDLEQFGSAICSHRAIVQHKDPNIIDGRRWHLGPIRGTGPSAARVLEIGKNSL